MSKSDQKTQRIITLDLIRGYFLLNILINHLNRFPGVFDIFTARGQLWTSAAEGFFLISGLLVGMIRGAEINRGLLTLSSKKMFKRAAVLYLWSVGLTIIFTLVGEHYLNNSGLKAGVNTPAAAGYWTWLEHILSLHYVYGWADFLQYYAVYMLLAPLFLWLLYKRLPLIAFAPVVLAFIFRGYNQYLIWQFYFFSGVLVGYYWLKIHLFFTKMPKNQRLRLLYSIYGVALTLIILDIVGKFLFHIFDKHMLTINHGLPAKSLIILHALNNSWFNRWDRLVHYGYGRIVISFVWFSALYFFVRSHEPWFKKRLGWLLLPIGCNPLLAYGFGAFFVFIIDLIFKYTTYILQNTLINALAVILSWSIVSINIRIRKKMDYRVA